MKPEVLKLCGPRWGALASLLGLLAGIVLLLPSAPPRTWAAAEGPTSEDLEHNRRLLELWRHDAGHWSRLQQDLKAFANMPAQQQERLRQLDRQLYQLDPAQRKRLLRVLERYTLWRERLSDKQRAMVDGAADTEERLALIRVLLRRQWLERLPQRTRTELEQLSPEERDKRLHQLQQREKHLQREWSRPHRVSQEQRPPKPARLEDFPMEVQVFVREQLLTQLSTEEKKQLEQARGKWPELPRLLMELTERHLGLPPLPGRVVRRYPDIPAGVKLMLGTRPELERLPAWKKVAQQEGKWPEFALACTELLKSQGRTMVPPLGASRPRDFSEPVQFFIKKQLTHALSKEETARLHAAEGKWPEYPRLVQELAHKHDLSVPGMSLPGPPELWNNAH